MLDEMIILKIMNINLKMLMKIIHSSNLECRKILMFSSSWKKKFRRPFFLLIKLVLNKLT